MKSQRKRGKVGERREVMHAGGTDRISCPHTAFRGLWRRILILKNNVSTDSVLYIKLGFKINNLVSIIDASIK